MELRAKGTLPCNTSIWACNYSRCVCGALYSMRRAVCAADEEGDLHGTLSFPVRVASAMTVKSPDADGSFQLKETNAEIFLKF